MPGFPTLARTARRVRALDNPTWQALDAPLIVDPITGRSPWEQIKQDIGSPTLRHLRERLDHLAWLEARNVGSASLASFPDVKIEHFAAEARTLDVARKRDLEPAKRATLTAALLAIQTARTRDDLGEMFIKCMLSIHQQAREALAAYRERHAQQTDALITTFRDVVAAYRSEGTAEQRFAVIDVLIGSRSDTLLEQCEAHIANTTNTYLPFLWPCFKSYRATLFRLLHALELQATTGIRDWKARSAYCWRTGSASANGSLPLKHRLSGAVRSNEHPWWMCRGFPRVGGCCSAMCVHVQPIHAAFARRSGLTPLRHIENFHNFAWIEDGLVVHRKGATPAGKGVLGIIPGSMATNSYIVAGNGNPESLQSASHGAGRRFSRTQARNSISMADVRRFLAERDVLAEGVAVDEAPQAYKDVERVIELEVAAGLITPIARMRPVAVIMAGEKGED